MKKKVVCTKGVPPVFKIGQTYDLFKVNELYKTINKMSCYLDAVGVLTVNVGEERALFEEIEENQPGKIMKKNVVCTKGAAEFKIGQEYVLVDCKGYKTIGNHTCYIDADGVLAVDIGKERALFEEVEVIEINQLPANSHYFIDVSEYKTIDVYAICKLYNLQDSSGALHHALKKILCPGKRSGGKSQMQDIKEAIATLERFVDLHDSKE